MKDEYLSVHREPALVGQQEAFSPDPAEERATFSQTSPSEIEALRDSVFNEPSYETDIAAEDFRLWLKARRAQCSLAGSIALTTLAGLAGGPGAVVGAFMAGSQGYSQLAYVILFGPIIEEMLKQSGILYVLEQKPYRVFSAAQIGLAAVTSALIFAVIENLLYLNVYVAGDPAVDLEELARFRWTVCTALHVFCSLIASMGLMAAWRKQQEDGRPLDLQRAYPYFVVAMAAHGIYNLIAISFGTSF